ncbi:aminodeoxychorismate synthase component I [Longimicrobium sp.]|uniref:aminodeoxychorismate synthase component I n=1 Tax=Longimicrobium sp. TaxID=2029185 RepID=UPI003B3AAAF7
MAQGAVGRARDASAAAGAAAVRFDAPGGPGGARSFRFRGLRTILRAERLDEVVGVLQAVERAAAEGLHAAGFVAYEAAPAFDPALATHPPDPRLPLAWFAVYVSRDDVVPTWDAAGGEAELGAWSIDVPESEYLPKVERVRALIAAGDTYQTNFTARLRASFRGDPVALYERLCLGQRSAFCACFDLGDGTTVVSASPELFFRAEGRELELKPMKGTRPRGRWTAEDRALAAELARSPKDRAENLMIVDLLRNDAGRLAEFGSVRVERLYDVERYETVHQMTSTIRARLRPDVGLADVFRALFPCGSVTGAPKVRTMEIIRDLEPSPRGVYCGAIGLVSPGEAVFSVGIRTLLLDAAAGTAELGVGSGITWDSDSAAEYRESWSKAAFVRRAPAGFRLLETMLWEPADGWFLLDGHLRRLADSAEYWGYAFDADEAVRRLSALVPVFVGLPMRVRLMLDREGRMEIEARTHVPSNEPARIAIAAEPVDSADPRLYHKTTSRAMYERRAASRPDSDDVLLVNERGELTESAIANLVVRIDGALWTPPLECGLLPGVLRAHLLATGEIRERVLHPADLARAEDVWLINSVRKWRAAVVIP